MNASIDIEQRKLTPALWLLLGVCAWVLLTPVLVYGEFASLQSKNPILLSDEGFLRTMSASLLVAVLRVVIAAFLIRAIWKEPTPAGRTKVLLGLWLMFAGYGIGMLFAMGGYWNAAYFLAGKLIPALAWTAVLLLAPGPRRYFAGYPKAERAEQAAPLEPHVSSEPGAPSASDEIVAAEPDAPADIAAVAQERIANTTEVAQALEVTAEDLYQRAEALLRGDRVQWDGDAGVRLLRQAARQGHPRACLALGLRHLDGDGVVPDPREASRLFAIAGEGGLAGGYSMLGYLNQGHVNHPVDLALSLECFDRAARMGDDDARMQAARLRGSAGDVTEA